MNIGEAFKISKEIKIKGPEGDFYLDLSTGDYYQIPIAYLSLTNWEPVLPEKKTVKKKFYQVVFYEPGSRRYFISESLFEAPHHTEQYARNNRYELVRFLVENPIEVEVEE